jgi:hypothetical protein
VQEPENFAAVAHARAFISGQSLLLHIADSAGVVFGVVFGFAIDHSMNPEHIQFSGLALVESAYPSPKVGKIV